MVYSQESWSAAELAELEQKRRELGLWQGKGEQWRLRQDEFPAANQSVALHRVINKPEVPGQTRDADRQRKEAAQRKAEKRQRKAQAQSKRRNRRGKLGAGEAD